MRPCNRLAIFYAVFLATTALLVSASSAQVPSLVYATSFGSSFTEHAYGIATDASDNIILVGSAGTSIDMGGGSLSGSGTSGSVLAKYDSGGTHLWSFMTSSAIGSIITQDITTDPAGNIYIVGRLLGTFDFGAGPLTATSNGSAFVAKYSPAGVHLWSQAFPGGFLSSAKGVAVDATGNVFVTGQFFDDIDLGGGTVLSNGGSDIFLARFDTNGVHQWSQGFGGASAESGEALDLDGSGNLIVGGTLVSADFGGGVLTTSGQIDAFLSKFDPSGAYLWSTQFGGTSVTKIYFLDASATDDIAFCGEFSGSSNFASTTLVSQGGPDGFVGRCDASGNVLWVHAIGGAQGDRGLQVRIGPNDAVLSVGYVFQTAQVGGAPPVVGSSTSLTLVAVKYLPSGVHEWTKIIGDGNIANLAIDTLGSFYVFSDFATSVNIDGVILNSVGTLDFYSAKYFDQQAVPVVFQSFTAIPRASAIDISWTLGDAAALDSYVLLRSEDRGPTRAIAAGPATDDGIFRDSSVEAGRTYHYELRLRTLDGFELSSEMVAVTVPRMVNSLSQNSPNPFNPRTTIRYSLADRSSVVIEIFDVSGALVRRLVEGDRGPGAHQVEWDGTDDSARPVASGNYYYRLVGSTELLGRTMTLVK